MILYNQDEHVQCTIPKQTKVDAGYKKKSKWKKINRKKLTESNQKFLRRLGYRLTQQQQ